MAICGVIGACREPIRLPTAAHSIRPSNFWRISSQSGRRVPTLSAYVTKMDRSLVRAEAIGFADALAACKRLIAVADGKPLILQ